MLRSGFGARTAKSVSSTSAGKQSISDHGKGADSVIRAIAGSDLAVWLDADDITGVATDGLLSTWTAKAGTAPAQSTADNQPNYQPAGLNNRPAVQFDSSRKDFLYWVNGGLNASDQPENTIILVSNSAANDEWQIIFELGNPNHWQNNDGLGQWYSNTNLFYHSIGSGDATKDSYEYSTKEICGTGTDLSNVLISSYNRNGATPSSTVVPSINAFINSEPITVAGSPAPAYDAGDATNSAWSSESAHLGARVSGVPSGGTPSYPLDGALREFIVLNRETTAGEAFRLGKALMAKSGITRLLSNY
tara:strand:+ start:77 stop:991 length:915 start_codon:yes stop_codon:yes gene_type:complete